MASLRQRFLNKVYPLLMRFTKLSGRNALLLQNRDLIPPPIPFYDLQVMSINGKVFPLEKTRGKKVLLVNTASDCGYTPQYDELQKLHDDFGQRLVVIGFPSNDFKNQERGTDEQIEQFCKASFGVNFLLAKKTVVVNSADQNEVFKWLTQSARNGWNDQQPVWNFSKYLLNEEGVLTHFFGPAISPLSPSVIDAING